MLMPQPCLSHHKWCNRGELNLSPSELDSVSMELRSLGMGFAIDFVACGAQLLLRQDSKRSLTPLQQDRKPGSVSWQELGEWVFKEIVDFAGDRNMLQLIAASRSIRHMVAKFCTETIGTPVKLCTDVGIVGFWRRFPFRQAEARLRDIAKVQILTDHTFPDPSEVQAFSDLVRHITRCAAPTRPTSFFFDVFTFPKDSLWILGPHKNADMWLTMGDELPPSKSSKVFKFETGDEFWLELTYNIETDEVLLSMMSMKMLIFRNNRRRTRNLEEILAKCLLCPRGDGLKTGRHCIQRHIVREHDPIHAALRSSSGAALPFVVAVGPSLLDDSPSCSSPHTG